MLGNRFAQCSWSANTSVEIQTKISEASSDIDEYLNSLKCEIYAVFIQKICTKLRLQLRERNWVKEIGVETLMATY